MISTILRIFSLLRGLSYQLDEGRELSATAKAAGTPPAQGPTNAPDSGDNTENIRQEWLQTAYTEAWKQYSHEDTLALQRNNFFITIQTALLAVLASVTTALFSLEPLTLGSYSFYMNYVLIGIFMFTFAAFAQRLLDNWAKATQSGQAFVALRWSTCRNIEEEVDLESVSIARVEEGLRAAIEAKDPDFCPYPSTPCMEDYKIKDLGIISEDAIFKLIDGLKRMWDYLRLLGIAVILAAIAFPFINPDQKAASQPVTITGPVTIIAPNATAGPTVGPNVPTQANPGSIPATATSTTP